MTRGTTAYFKFIMPYPHLQSAKVVFWQNYNNGPSDSRPLPITKVLAQCSQNDYELRVSLTPEETLRFSDKRRAYVQLMATSSDGLRFASRQQMFTVYPVRDEDTGDDNVLPTPDNSGLVILDGGQIV